MPDAVIAASILPDLVAGISEHLRSHLGMSLVINISGHPYTGHLFTHFGGYKGEFTASPLPS